MDSVCGYCYDQIGENDFLECEECEQYIHVRCLRRPGTPGDFHGDVFYTFTCTTCTPNFIEKFERHKLPWTMILILTIHNLSKQSQGLSRRGYFHWRSHIAHFIDKNWSFLMDPRTKRRKNWIGTVSGILSHHSPTLFASGYDIFNESGWWKLTHNMKPREYYQLVKTSRKEKPVTEDVTIAANETDAPIGPLGKRRRQNADNDDNDGNEEHSCRRTMPFIGKQPWRKEDEPGVEAKQEPEIDILDYFEPMANSNFLDEMPLRADLFTEDPFNVTQNANALNDELLTNSLFQCDMKKDATDESEKEIANEYQPRIIEVKNYQYSDDDKTDTELEINGSSNVPNMMIDDNKIEEEEVPHEVKYACPKSLFGSKSTEEFHQYPWQRDAEASHECNEDFISDKNIDLMSEYEENEIYKRLKSVFDVAEQQNIEIPPWIRRHYRKLCVRRMQRNLGIPIFNVQKFGKKMQKDASQSSNVLDRYHQLITASGNFSSGSCQSSGSFMSRLVGSCKYELFVSPHTERLLHPFIYRNESCCPPWVRLLCELQHEVNGIVPNRSSIDYCYVRPQHIPAVNALLQRLFWPGIDMSECLSYPDFSIVALYKKLVVGCAFLVPDVGHNEAYVSFMSVRPGWQRAGIATFMLYHLTQTCIGKDITLHVSADNPAICLYQKFGFKIQELILDFYDKYLPYDSTQSRHGFLLRLER